MKFVLSHAKVLGPNKIQNSCKMFILLAMMNKKAQLFG